MITRYYFQLAVSVLCLALLACGNRPAREPQTAEKATPPPDTAVRPQDVARTHAAESAHNSAVSDQQPAGAVADSVSEIIRRTYPGATSVRAGTQPFAHCVICDGSGKTVGYEVFSDSAGTTARGYAGPVPLQVFFDVKGKPVRICVLDNSETPAYLEIVYNGGLLEKLLAWDPARSETLDAVTLATSSSRAIIAGVTGLAVKVTNELVDR